MRIIDLGKSNLLNGLLMFFLGAIFFISCSNSDGRDSTNMVDTLTNLQTEKMLKSELIAKNDTFPLIKYRNIVLNDMTFRNQIYNEYEYNGNNFTKNKTFRTLNREETRFLRTGEKLVIPDTFILDQRAYSIFPIIYWQAREIPKILIVSNKYQAYGAYEYGKLVRFSATNTGKEATQTYPGRYALAWKKAKHRSSLDSNWVMPYNFNFHPNAGNAFHQFTMPGRPVSHSCCRQFLEDAKWLYYWGETTKRGSNGKYQRLSGTPVLIIDHFDFSRKRGGPWLELTSNKDKVINLPEDPMNYELALIPMCQIPPSSRHTLPGGYSRYVHAEDTLRARGVIRPHVILIQTKNFNIIRRKKADTEAKKKIEIEKNIQKESEFNN